MLIDADNLANLTVTERTVIGKAKRDAGLLIEGELVLMADGVRNFIETVVKEFPQAGGSMASERGMGYNDFRTYEDCVNTFLNNPQSLVKYKPTEMRPTDRNEQGLEVDYDVTGDFIDMGRYMEGVPETFGSLHNGNPRSRRVVIYVDNGNAGSISNGDIAHRSERIIRLIDALENAQVRCELTVLDSGECAHSECIVKKFNESLSLEDVAVATHPSFLRRLCFRIMENSDTYERTYGSSLWIRDHLDDFRSNVNDELTILVHSNMDYGIDRVFDELEELLVKELSESVPSIGLIEVDDDELEVHEL